jgi:DNA-binding NarL/FixJ family response regulator
MKYQTTFSELYKELFKREEKHSEIKEPIIEKQKISLKQTELIATDLKLSYGQLVKIREEVRKGKTKTQVAAEVGLPYYKIRKYTKDIPPCYRLPLETKQKIREEVEKGKTKRSVAKELNVSYDVVKRYTKDIVRNVRTPPEIKEQIRKNVRKYNSKIETARKMGVSYIAVKSCTNDMIIRREIPVEKILEIRRKVKSGKLKTQVGREMNISIASVCKYTEDIYAIKKRADIGCREFSMLQEIMNKGYAFNCSRFGFNEYRVLKRKLKKICRVKMYGKIIYFLKDNSDVAMRAFLENVNKTTITYRELQQIINLFGSELTKKERKKYVMNRR